jgi:hypothetical protein
MKLVSCWSIEELKKKVDGYNMSFHESLNFYNNGQDASPLMIYKNEPRWNEEDNGMYDDLVARFDLMKQ